jgi:hypothetical protein
MNNYFPPRAEEPSEEFPPEQQQGPASGRVPLWWQEEQARRAVEELREERPEQLRAQWPSDAPRRPSPASRRRGATLVIGFLTATVLFICLGAFLYGGFRPLTLLGLDFGTTSSGLPLLGQRSSPTPGREEAEERLGVPAPLFERSSSYLFLHTSRGTPVSYSPCRPIHYVVNTAKAPAGSEVLVEAAVDRVSEATGFHFVFDGQVDEKPSAERESFQPDRYGDMWAPVLISWTDPATVPSLAGDTVGLGGSTRVKHPAGYTGYVSGQISLDAPQFRQILARPGGHAQGAAVIMHELAHVLGLGHVADSSQLMFEHGTPLTDFASGDLTGLSMLASAPCTKLL